MSTDLKLEAVVLQKPPGTEIICGQGTFNLLAIEDLHRAIAVAAPRAAFGIAFSEASDNLLVRTSGNTDELINSASENLIRLGCGHCYVVVMRNCYPIQVLPHIKVLPNIISIKVATGNSAVAVVARLPGSSAFLGVADGGAPVVRETEEQARQRQEAVRKIGYLERRRG